MFTELNAIVLVVAGALLLLVVAVAAVVVLIRARHRGGTDYGGGDPAREGADVELLERWVREGVRK